jgi:hypothetical protein
MLRQNLHIETRKWFRPILGNAMRGAYYAAE